MKKYLFIVIGILGIILFSLPLWLSANLNLGNFTGLLLSAVFLLSGLFPASLSKLMTVIRGSVPGRITLCILKIVICVIVFTAVILTVLMIHSAGNKPEGNETIIVLGCRVYGEKPSLSLTERLDATCRHMQKYPDTKCIVSGGQGDGESITESECMYRYLVKKGISKERIFKEERSRNTRENILFSLKIAEENGLSGKISIATSDYHQFRAHLIAQKLGVQNTAISGKSAPWLLPTYYVRELYAVLYELLNLNR